MWLSPALPPPPALISTTYDDEKCPRRDCPVKMSKPRSVGADQGRLDEQFGASIYVKDTSEFTARFR